MKNFFFNVHLWKNEKKISKIWDHILQTVLSQFFLCFLCKSPGWNKKKLLKTEQQCTFVYIMNLNNFYWLLGIFAALRPSFKYFHIFFQGFSSMSGKVWFIRIFWLFFKNFYIFILREICKRRHCPPSVTLALLLWIFHSSRL